MNVSSSFRIAGIGLIAVAAIASALAITPQPDAAPDTSVGTAIPNAAPSTLDQALLHCAELGEAGGRDTLCLRAWAENRHRFLGRRPDWPDDAPDGQPRPRPAHEAR